MDKCIICQRVYDTVPPFCIKLDDDPNCDYCDRRWCTDCSDANDLYVIVKQPEEVKENKIKCFLCVFGERTEKYRILYRD